ncbi:MAG TPA: hypothetical protein VFO67_14080 [Gemmatimonadales bacterium]|nr:hypothetical protein [Gemmatimonadales bacterium]
MRRFALVAASTLAMACASHTTPSNPTPSNPAAPPPPAPPPPPATQTVRLGPSALRYVMHQVIHIEQELPTGPQVLDYGLRVFFAVTISGPADSSGYPTTITIDSVAPDSGTTIPMGVNLSVAKGLSFRGRLSPRGDFRDPVPSDSAAALAVSPIVGSFRNFFPRLPAGGATLGATWSDTTTDQQAAVGTITVTSVNRSRAAVWEDRNATRALRVEVTSDFTIHGRGQQMGQSFEVNGSGARSGADYVAIDGRFLGGESRDSTNMTIVLPMQSMTIPRKQASRTTVTVLP